MARERPKWLEARTVLLESGGLADTSAGWRHYVGYLGVLAEDDAQAHEGKFGRLSRGWVIGSAEFKASLKDQLAATPGREGKFELLGADREAHRQTRALLWDDALRLLANAFGTELDRLPRKKSAAQKVKLAAAMKSTTSVSNRGLSERLQTGKSTNVSSLTRHFRLHGGTEARDFKATLSRFTT